MKEIKINEPTAITLPEGYEAKIEGNKVILVPKESEDERIRKALIQFLTDIKGISESGRTTWSVRREDAEMCNGFLIYLERQKEQKPAEWSEEDKENKETAIRFLNTFAYRAKLFDKNGEIKSHALRSCVDWLKSLRPQPHWKPSEEQMQALELVLEYHVFANPQNKEHINSLYNDLKKL